MATVKQIFKRNTHNRILKSLAGFGRAMNRLYENRNHDIKSNGELVVLKKIASLQPSVIIDGGANSGDYSLLANSLAPGCRIYAFEPVASTYEKLLENTSEYEKIIPVNNGLYKDNCSKEINLFNSDTHSSLYDLEGISYSSEVKERIMLVKGDDFIRDQNLEKLDFLKLDIEGAEYDALLGFSRCIEDGLISAVQFEYGYINITTRKLLIDFSRFFEKNNYIVGKIFPKKVEFRNYEFKHEDFIGTNFLAVKRSEKDLINLLEN